MPSHEEPRAVSSGQPSPEAGDISAEGTAERIAGILGHWGPVDTENDKGVDANFHTFAPLQVGGELALLHSEKAEALADSFEVQYHQVNLPRYLQLLTWLKRRCGRVCRRKWTEINQSLWGPTGPKGTQA
jgi:hypothetical protein